MPVNSCQLKALTQPKLQHILLKSSFMKAKENPSSPKHSLLRSTVKKSQQKTTNNLNISKQMKLSRATTISSCEKLRSKTLLDEKSSK